MMALPVPIKEIINFISGSFHGIPTIVVMILPFVVGLVIGFFIKKVLKIAIIGLIIALIASYFGFINLTSTASELKDMAFKYGPEAYGYLTLVVGMLPLGLGFFIGLLVGLLRG